MGIKKEDAIAAYNAVNDEQWADFNLIRKQS